MAQNECKIQKQISLNNLRVLFPQENRLKRAKKLLPEIDKEMGSSISTVSSYHHDIFGPKASRNIIRTQLLSFLVRHRIRVFFK